LVPAFGGSNPPAPATFCSFENCPHFNNRFRFTEHVARQEY